MTSLIINSIKLQKYTIYIHLKSVEPFQSFYEIVYQFFHVSPANLRLLAQRQSSSLNFAPIIETQLFRHTHETYYEFLHPTAAILIVSQFITHLE